MGYFGSLGSFGYFWVHWECLLVPLGPFVLLVASFGPSGSLWSPLCHFWYPLGPLVPCGPIRTPLGPFGHVWLLVSYPLLGRPLIPFGASLSLSLSPYICIYIYIYLYLYLYMYVYTSVDLCIYTRKGFEGGHIYCGGGKEWWGTSRGGGRRDEVLGVPAVKCYSWTFTICSSSIYMFLNRVCFWSGFWLCCWCSSGALHAYSCNQEQFFKKKEASNTNV